MWTRAPSSVLFVTALVVLVGCADLPPPNRWQSAPGSVASPEQDAREARSAEGSTPTHVLSPDASRWGLILGLYAPLGVLLLVSGVMAWRHHARRRREDAWRPEGPLSDGQTAVFGVVETEDRGEAISLQIEQAGREGVTRQGYHHRWNEVRREWKVRPFDLRLAGGRRVRVEPGAQVVLRDKLNRTRKVERNLRRRVATIAAGERVWVSGTLSGAAPEGAEGYRSASVEPVLRPPAQGPMVVSTEAPGAFPAERAALHRRWFLRLLAVMVVVHCTVLLDVTALSLFGSVAWSRVDATAEWQVWVKPKNNPGYWSTRYAVRVREPGGALWEAPCGAGFYRCASTGACGRVPVRSALGGLRQLGERTTVSELQLVALVLLSIVLCVVYARAVVSTRPWYDRRKVHDRGPGPLT